MTSPRQLDELRAVTVKDLDISLESMIWLMLKFWLATLIIAAMGGLVVLGVLVALGRIR